MTIGEEFTLQLVCERIGLPDLARRVPSLRIGMIEAELNAALYAVDFKTEPGRWFQLEAAKMCARRIRKPINEFNEYMTYADRVLGT